MALTAMTLAALAALLLGGGKLIGDEWTKSNHKASKDRWINEQLESVNDPNSPYYGMTRADIKHLADYYQTKNPGWFDTALDYAAIDADAAEYLKIKDKLGDRPENLDFEAILNDANQTIDDENAQMMQSFDDSLARTEQNLQSQLQQSNQAYNQFVNQNLTNNVQAQNMMLGGIRSELDRAHRTAITRGASAAMQLVSNINTQLGIQNQAAQQSLQTSNMLAQSLLNQRQAAMGISSQYNDAINNNANQKAGLISGTAERKASYGQSQINQAQSVYDNKMANWNATRAAYSGDNPFVDVYDSQQIRKQSSTPNSNRGI